MTEQKVLTRVEEVFNQESDGMKAVLRGWIHRKFNVGGKIFLRLRDSTGVVQCVVDKAVVEEDVYKEIEEAKRESSVVIEGVVRKEKRAPGGFEVLVEKARVVGYSDDFPIKGGEGIDFLLEKRHLWLRSRKLTSVMKIKHSILKALRQYYIEEGWWEVTPPILTASAVEGGATLFKVDYFGEPAYLSQSAQLYLEVLVYSLEKVWSITPSFRAEKSRTRRHLSEYTHFEAEAAWMDMDEMMRVAEKTVEYVIATVVEERRRELEELGRDISVLEKVRAPFPRITYTEAVEILKKDGMIFEWGMDFGADEEAVLTRHFDTPFFVTLFPKKIKAFYMKLYDKNPNLVLGFDMLAPEGYGEIIGGSQREDNYEILLNRIREEGLDPADYQWYLDLRRYGSVPHSGYGLGVERLLMWIAGLDHIRDTTPFPRFRGRITP